MARNLAKLCRCAGYFTPSHEYCLYSCSTSSQRYLSCSTLLAYITQQATRIQSMSKKENALDLAKFLDKSLRVKLAGGREVVGVLKGYDQLLNLVLDEATEFLRDPEDPLRVTDQTRFLGLVVCRGTSVMLVMPTAGTEEIANPFIQQEDQ